MSKQALPSSTRRRNESLTSSSALPTSGDRVQYYIHQDLTAEGPSIPSMMDHLASFMSDFQVNDEGDEESNANLKRRGGDDGHVHKNNSDKSMRKKEKKAKETKNDQQKSTSSQPLRKTHLQGRLQYIVVFELREDGSREFLTMTLRQLYDYSLKCITNRHKVIMPDGSTKQVMGDNHSHFSSDRVKSTSPNYVPKSASPDILISKAVRSSSVGSTGPAPALSTIFEREDTTLVSHVLTPSSNGNNNRVETRDSNVVDVFTTLPPPALNSSATGVIDTNSHSATTTSTYQSVSIPSTAGDTGIMISNHGVLSSSPTSQQLSFLAHQDHQGIRRQPTASSANTRNIRSSLISANLYPPHNIVTSSDSYTGMGGTVGQPPIIPIHRERLGGYLHPRDMRRLVTPFSSSNEPELMVRRHVMLLNFDPLRAIVLRDRLLILVPDGADSILIDLERLVRGGADELHKQFFGDENNTPITIMSSSSIMNNPMDGDKSVAMNKIIDVGDAVESRSFEEDNKEGSSNLVRQTFQALLQRTHVSRKQCDDGTDDLEAGNENLCKDFSMDGDQTDHASNLERNEASRDNICVGEIGVGSKNGLDTRVSNAYYECEEKSEDDDLSIDDTTETTQDEDELHLEEEWENIEGRYFIDMSFELQAVDAVLATVCKMLSEDTSHLKQRLHGVMDEFRGNSVSSGPGDHVQEELRILKDSIKEMEARVQGMIRAINQTLDEEEDMALMNLSRLITHPDRFLQPVSQEILSEESDEPELILEAYLQHALSEFNALELLKGSIVNTEELVSLKMDAIRNRLLYINTMVSVFTFTVTCASLVGSFFGMNLTNHLESSDTAWWKVIFITSIVCLVICLIFMWLLFQADVLPSCLKRALRKKKISSKKN